MITFSLTETSNEKLNSMVNDILALAKKEVLVGVPEEKDDRETEQGEKKSPIGNAALAAIHDNGSPVQNIPARPFMEPGIQKVQERVNNFLIKACHAQLDKKKEEVAHNLEKAGLVTQSSIRNVIEDGENFAPLKRGTLLARARKRKYMKLNKQEKEELMASMHPLVDTADLLKSISYVVVNK